MNRSPAFQFYPDKWQSHTRRLSDSSYRVFHELLCWMWQHSPDHASIEASPQAVACAVAIPLPEVEMALAEINNPYSPLLKLEDGRWVSNGLRKEHEKQESWRGKSSLAGKKSAAKRATLESGIPTNLAQNPTNLEKNSTNVQPTLTETEDSADRSGGVQPTLKKTQPTFNQRSTNLDQNTNQRSTNLDQNTNSPSPSPTPSPSINAEREDARAETASGSLRPKVSAIPTVEEVIAHGATIGVSPEDCRAWHAERAGELWADRNGLTIGNWRAYLRAWRVKAQVVNQNPATGTPGGKNGHSGNGLPSPTEVILRTKELDRCEARIKAIRDSVDSHQSLPEKDRAELRRLKERVGQLKTLLSLAA